jgi:hypothetical protein
VAVAQVSRIGAATANQVKTLGENTSQEMLGLLLDLIKDAVMYLKSYSVIQARSVAWTLGVQDLLRGFLPANIISPDQVQAMLDEVKRALSVEHSGYAIAHNSASYYYQVQVFYPI